MKRVLIDTNELLRMASGGSRSELAQSWSSRKFELLMSLATPTELRAVLSRPETHKFIEPTLSAEFLVLVEQHAIFVQPDLSAPTCRDPEDTSLIATAVGGRAHCLVTADSDLLDDPVLLADLKARGIQVMRAAEFLAQLE